LLPKSTPSDDNSELGRLSVPFQAMNRRPPRLAPPLWDPTTSVAAFPGHQTPGGMRACSCTGCVECSFVLRLLDPGEIVLLVGPSGSGKTSLLSVLGCILRPTSGQVWIGGVDAAQVNEVRLSELRARNFGYVFQHYNLFGALTARENVEAAQRMKFGSVPKVRDETSRLLDRVGLANRS
jgi:ABC transporter